MVIIVYTVAKIFYVVVLFYGAATMRSIVEEAIDALCAISSLSFFLLFSFLFPGFVSGERGGLRSQKQYKFT